MADEDQDRRCGVGGLKNSSCLQKCANLLCYSITNGIIALAVVGSYTYMSSMQTTSQTVFSFSSQDIGVWYAMFEVGSILSNVFSSYFLTSRHIPRVLASGLLLFVAGCILHGLPHFFIDYKDKLKGIDEDISAADHITQSLCQTSSQMIATTTTLLTNSTTVANKEQAQNIPATILYCIGGFIMGLGYAPFYCLSLVYIDNNVEDVHDTAKYVSIVMACYTVGPIVGFGAGAAFLKLYVTLGETYLTEADSQWIGAYWVGYFVFAGFLITFVFLLCMYPKKLPKTPKLNTAKEGIKLEDNCKSASEKADRLAEEIEVAIPAARNITGLFKSLGRLFTNPLYLLVMLANCTAGYYTSGWTGFLPKYFETVFNFSSSDASIYGGALPPLFGAVAVFVGGFLTSKYKLSLQKNVIFLTVGTGLGAVFLIPTHFLTCEQFSSQLSPANTSSCVDPCKCDADMYVPLCYDGQTYKSPCIVGCDGYTTIDDKIHYTGCLCGQNITMVDGICQSETCNAPYIYMVCAIFSMASLGSCVSVGINIIMRSVSEEDKSFALGIQSSLASLLAWIPAPILYGTIIDSTCNIWEFPEAKDRGYCMEYFNTEYKTKYLWMTLGTVAVTCLLCAAAIPASGMKKYKELEKLKEKATAAEESKPEENEKLEVSPAL